VGIHAGQFFDEADVAAVRLQIYGGEREPSCFHLGPPAWDKKAGYAIKLSKV
jgi:hypothetical protein